MPLFARRDTDARRTANRSSKPRAAARRQFLQVEQLEERAVLTGNVIVHATGGFLQMIGDANANQLRVTRVGTSGVQVTSLDGTTNINGSATPKTFNNVTQGILANLGNGNDVLELNGSSTDLFRMLSASTINTGEGNDTLRFTNYSNWGPLVVLTGGGDDQVIGQLDAVAPAITVGGLRAGGPAIINTGNGNDTVSLRNSTFQSTLILDTGLNNDTVDIRSSAFQGVTSLNGSLGTDSLNNAGNTFRYPPVILGFETRTAINGPIANNDTATAAENGSVTVSVLANDTTTSGTLNVATVAIVQGPARGSAVVNPDGTITYTQNGSELPTDSFTYTVRDSQGNISNVATVNVTVTGVNDLPVATNDAFTVNEGATATLNLAANDADAENRLNLGSIQIVTQPTNGTVTVGTGGNVTYVSNGNEVTSDSFTYTIADLDTGVSTAATVNITITPVNDAPTIGTIANVSTNEDTATAPPIAVTVNDAETAAGSLTVTATSSNTTLVPNANIIVGGTNGNRTLTITPAANQAGTSTITVSVTDGNNSTTTTTFVLTVDPQNDAPTIGAVANVTTNEDTAAPAFNITLDDAETPNALTVTATSSDPNVVANADVAITGTGTTRSVVVTPVANAAGTSTITLSVSDGTATTTQTFLVTVNPVNDAPTIGAVANVTTNEDTPAAAFNITIGDQETPNALTVTATSSDPNVVADAGVVVTGAGTTRSVVVTPVANASGTSTITLSVSDGTATTTQTFLVTVNPQNDTPTIDPVAAVTTNEDTAAAAFSITIGDLETPEALTVTASSSDPNVIANNGVVITGTGTTRSVVVTPVANASGTSTITLTVSDGTATATQTFLVTVSPLNDPPTIATIADITVDEDTPIAPFNITVGDLETPETIAFTVTSDNTDLVPNANVVITGTGDTRSVAITPVANSFGVANITVEVSDGNGGTTTETFAVNVTSVNDLPVAVDDNADVDFVAGSTSAVVITGNVLTNDTDADVGATLNVTGLQTGTVGQSILLTYGTLVINADGSFTYTVDPNAVDELLAGTDVQELFDYTVSDGIAADVGQLSIDLHIIAGGGA